MIIFNWLGLLFAVLGLVAGYAAQAVVGPVGDSNGLAVTIAAVAMGLLDVGHRWHAHKSDDWWFVKPTTGGHFMFVPVWTLAAGCLLIGVLEMTQGPR